MVELSKGLVWGGTIKGAGLCALASAVAAWFWGPWVALSVWGGTLLGGANVWGMAWLIERMLGGGGGGGVGPGALLFFFALKLLVLFGLTYYLVVVLGLSALGFVAGYVVLLAGLMWQAVSGTQ